MGKAAVTLGGVLVLALLAFGLTEATLAVGRRGGITDDTLLRSSHSSQSTVRAVMPKPSPSASPQPSSSPAAASGPVATTNAFVHLRAGKSTSTVIVLDLNGGSQVQLLPDADDQWQQVEYNGSIGYIFKAYLDY